MSRTASVPLLACLALVAAGCVTPPATDLQQAGLLDPESGLPLWVVQGMVSGPEHDHSDPAQHAQITTPNFHTVGYDPLVTQRYGKSAGGGCGGTGVTAEGRKLAVSGGPGDVGFTVADVTDPTAPVYLGEFLLPNIVIWDVTITPDAKHVLVGGYSIAFPRQNPVLPPLPGAAIPHAALAAGTSASDEPWQMLWRDACTGETRPVAASRGVEQYLPYGPGIVMVSVADPANPELEDWVSQPIGPHSVGAHLVGDKMVATASITNLVHKAGYYTFFEIVDTPAGRGKLVPLSTITLPGNLPEGELNGHVDVYIAEHPATGKATAWLANWDGVYTYDVTDLRMPKMLGSWKDGDVGSLHTTYPIPVMWGDKHYTIAGQEVGEPEELPGGWVYVLDDTDPADIKEVGRWTLPMKVPWGDKSSENGGLTFSPHYVTVKDTTLFVTNYHGGIWALDISDPTQPGAVGHFYPTRTAPDAEPTSDGIGDILLDPETGDLVTWGFSSGVYVLRFDAAAPMPKPPAWDTAE